MKNPMRRVDRIQEVLGKAHRSGSPKEPGPFFAQKVMRRIAEEGAASKASSQNAVYLGRAAWRFALVGYLVVFALTAQLMLSDADSRYQLAHLVTDDTPSLDLIDPFEIL